MNANYTFLPSSINLNEITTDKKLQDRLALQLSNYLSVISNNYKDYQANGSVRLKAEYLKKWDYKYSETMSILEYNEILKKAGNYTISESSFPYSLNADVAGLDFVKYEYQDPKFKYHFNKKILKIQTYTKKILKPYHYLTKWYDSDKLFIDPEIGKEKIMEMEVQNQYLHTYKHLQLLHQDHYFKIDSTAGRFHTPITNLKRELRASLSYKGERLYSIDIVNCQPYLSQILTQPSFWNMRNNLKLKYYNKINTNKELMSIMIPKVVQCNEKQLYSKFLTEVNNGNFYENFTQTIKESTGVILERNDAKVAIYQTFFSDNRFINASPIPRFDASLKKLFKLNYPDIYEIFAAVKRKESNALAILLQNIESEIIIENVCPYISKYLPDCPIYTIHDSIATTEKHIETVSDILKYICFQYIGAVPTLKIEPW